MWKHSGAFLFALALAAHGAVTPNFEGASWVWADTKGDGIELADAPNGAAIYLRRSFDLPAGATVSDAVFSLTADKKAQSWLNGKPLVNSNPYWGNSAAVDITKDLLPGHNVIAIAAQNISLPVMAAGVIAQLTVHYHLADGDHTLVIGTDDSWLSSPTLQQGWVEPGFVDSDWLPAVEMLPVGGFPWESDFTGGEMGRKRKVPDFQVGGDNQLLAPLHDLLQLHYVPGITCALWDPWMPHSLLWVGIDPPSIDASTRHSFRISLLGRNITPEGYVEERQQRGMGTPEGWAFPIWTQGGPGMGWHFSLVGNVYGSAIWGIHKSTNVSDWALNGAQTLGFDDLNGWNLQLTKADAVITTPSFSAVKPVSPYVRFEWRAQGLPRTAQPYLEWTTEKQGTFSPERRLYFSPVQPSDGLHFTMLPLYKIKGWDGPLTRFSIHFDNPAGAKVSIVALFTANDTRLPITNPDFILGSTDFFNWTGDLDFLRVQINRERLAMAFALREFGVDKNGLAYVPWPGHEGRSGVIYENGKKVIRPGEGVGNNYFDILPFGGWDAYLNIRIYAALRALASQEQAIDDHPQWNLPDSPDRRSAADLNAVADRLKAAFQEKFWSDQTRRFVGAIDADGVAHDYGFVPINLEAITYDLASNEQAHDIYDWLDGRRTVSGDTSQGEDIYKWRFGPRMTTLRNIDWYDYASSAPESVPFGGQVQDGGGVLGFSYDDVMARLKTLGPDDAWKRLKAINDWYKEVEAAGGYRKYYANHDGTLQGGGVSAGLGVDQEFFESVRVPSVLVYGFLGLDPRPDGLYANPQLPTDWPSLTVSNIVYQRWHFGLTADSATKTLTATVHEGDPAALNISVPNGWQFVKSH